MGRDEKRSRSTSDYPPFPGKISSARSLDMVKTEERSHQGLPPRSTGDKRFPPTLNDSASRGWHGATRRLDPLECKVDPGWYLAVVHAPPRVTEEPR